ncbi:MAG TPA: hypothetical protein VMA77_11500 [Solirubrobacteraceae bacterium]|nr:hypothetical protein [Solirubrobacteraceae bacterium]
MPTTRWTVRGASPAATKSRVRWRSLAIATVSGLLAFGLLPGVAQAHGPIAPAASRYVARPTSVPAGLEAKVVDGDLRMWLKVPPTDTVVVLDYRGAPYLRFSPSGVAVNHNSSMFYLNQIPVPAVPPLDLSSTTRPDWQLVTSGHAYEWHDGRLGALAAVAIAPGTSYVGRWNLPLRIDGHLTQILGGLWHAPDPPLVWFWPIVVIVMCVLAAWRVRRPGLDRSVAHALAVAALTAIVAGGLGLELHGRPTVSIFQLVELAAILAFVAWASIRVLSRRAGYFTFFLIGIAALWIGGELITTLLYGFVLIAVPAFVARAACAVCLGAGVGLLLLVFRLADHPARAARKTPVEAADATDGEPLRHAPGVPS